MSGETALHELHQLAIQKVKSGVRLLADMRRRVCSSSSFRMVDGYMRFLAREGRVVENWRDVLRVRVPRMKRIVSCCERMIGGIA